ncbi:hypothetical protein CROQUDRAFT_46087 [Cronartium quercuum f. sp. fusiforme G11]|uniref:Peptidase S9 prolyl oligopeptidase catalytic domain-containing protein n=1 Tax=Cronartium quercuum f. sp. fusiforme G11 TaxID=708437 RepID=A0A9P6NKK1_9BASI|nr:hypothetical protein CROQUDRAFT_46087 [Cronartium quercuum f. sp. fusiforme G11]
MRSRAGDLSVPSSFVDGGHATWQTFGSGSDDGRVEVAYPNVRWEYIRATSGWAGLQYITYLRAKLKIGAVRNDDQPVYVSGNLIEGYEWAIYSASDNRLQWYQGDMYLYSDTITTPETTELHPFAQTLLLPFSQDGEYTIIVKSVYDIRIKGDPLSIKRPDPTSSFRLDIRPWRVPPNIRAISVYPQSTLTPDVFFADQNDGRRMLSSPYLALIVRNWHPENMYRICTVHGKWAGDSKMHEVIGLVLNPIDIAPNQLTTIGLVLPDFLLSSPGSLTPMELVLTLADHQPLRVRIDFRKPKSTRESFIFTFLDADQSVQYAVCVPPSGRTPPSNPLADPIPQSSSDRRSLAKTRPLLVGLHGAGVEANSEFWISSIEQRLEEWILFPTGRTSWGWDWHGPSLLNVERAIEYLVGDIWKLWRSLIAKEANEPASACFQPDGNDLIVFGHSNGGQGAWYLATRYPDKVRAVIPAAAYIKIEDYVPYTNYQTKHLVDPLLGSIISIAQSIYSNDLHLSNLIHTPMLIKHGELDDNVPAYHSKTLYSLLLTWGADPDSVTFEGVPNQKHWFDDVFKSSSVRKFIDEQAQKDKRNPHPESLPHNGFVSLPFTLTVSNPTESGSKEGFRILMLRQGWRLGRIKVLDLQRQVDGWVLKIETKNVEAFQIPSQAFLGSDSSQKLRLVIDNVEIQMDEQPTDQLAILWRCDEKNWKMVKESIWREISSVKRTSPLTNVLRSHGPLRIIFGTRTNPKHAAELRSVANPLACRDLGSGNLIIIGNSLDNSFLAESCSHQDMMIMWKVGINGQACFSVADGLFEKVGQGIIYQIPYHLLPYPINSISSTQANPIAIVISGTDEIGMESALGLFPIRSGLNLPDWIVINETKAEDGSVLAAG